MSAGRVAFAPGRGGWIALIGACALAIGAAIVLYFVGIPTRGYTVTGLVAAVVALAAMVLAGAYSWRKRAGQEHTRGQLSAWLAWHLVLSALALAGAWLHSGAHFNGGSGTVTAALLLLALGSGVFGLLRYLRVPERVLANVGNLAPGTLELEIRRLQQQRDLILSGAASVDVAREMAELDAEIASRRELLARQASYHGKLRGWLWVHIPASIGLALVLVWHIAATWDTIFPPHTTSPLAFESAQDCRGCHSQQFQEWSGSMHAMAFQSPLTDIQNRLVLALEDRQLREHDLDKPLVGDLCVRCHAPLGFLPDPKVAQESISARVSDPHRTTTLEGITCSACHRMPESHRCDSPEQNAGLTFRRCEGGGGAQDRQFYNANNLEFTAGPAFYGPYGGPGERPAVGNSYHRGLLSGHADSSLEQRSAICASCHTVEVHDPADGSKVLVRLQDTYDEWLHSGNGKGQIAWHEQFACTDCHNAKYQSSLDQVDKWQHDRVCLGDRLRDIRGVMAKEFAEMPLRTSADPVNGIDRSLPPRTKLSHAFVGVDIHLEPDRLAGNDYPAFKGKVDVDTEKAIENTGRLLHQAAALRIDKVQDGKLIVDVANLATGHTLPAGFAFARELWVEVAVSRSDDGDDFEVVIGGKNGRPIAKGEPLNKQQRGLKNFQAVLFSKRFNADVVLQNQADTVLTGGPANKAGFQDRVGPIEPGDVAHLEIDLGSQVDLSDVRRVRTRLRFRSLPPEFLERMSKIADARGLVGDGERLRAMETHLHVFDVAEDESTLDGGLKCP